MSVSKRLCLIAMIALIHGCNHEPSKISLEDVLNQCGEFDSSAYKSETNAYPVLDRDNSITAGVYASTTLQSLQQQGGFEGYIIDLHILRNIKELKTQLASIVDDSLSARLSESDDCHVFYVLKGYISPPSFETRAAFTPNGVEVHGFEGSLYDTTGHAVVVRVPIQLYEHNVIAFPEF